MCIICTETYAIDRLFLSGSRIASPMNTTTMLDMCGMNNNNNDNIVSFVLSNSSINLLVWSTCLAVTVTTTATVLLVLFLSLNPIIILVSIMITSLDYFSIFCYFFGVQK